MKVGKMLTLIFYLLFCKPCKQETIKRETGIKRGKEL